MGYIEKNFYVADKPVFMQTTPDMGANAAQFFRFNEEYILDRDWKNLDAAAQLPTQIHSFSVALARSFHAQDIRKVFAYKRENTVCAVLPLWREKGYFSRWQMMGTLEIAEPNDALCQDAQAAFGLAEIIAQKSRAFSLDRVPATSAFIPAIRSAMKGKGYVSLRPAIACPTIKLDENWKQPENQFNAGRRSDFRRAARRASEFGTLSYEMHAPKPQEFDALFDEAIAVELCSWKKDAGTAIAVDHNKEKFFRDYLRAASAQGILRIAFLRIDGKAVAMHMALEYHDRYWLFKIGFDDRYEKCSPGTLLMLHCIGWAANKDLRAFELMGNIEPWIAAFWTKESHETVRLRIYPYSIRGAVAFLADTALWLRKYLPKAAL